MQHNVLNFQGVFGGQADSILTSMRDVLRDNIQKTAFPLEAIIERYKATNKDLRFDDDYIESLLDIQHGEGRCRALLHLLFPEMNSTEVFHIDHLHPRTAVPLIKRRSNHTTSSKVTRHFMDFSLMQDIGIMDELRSDLVDPDLDDEALDGIAEIAREERRKLGS